MRIPYFSLKAACQLVALVISVDAMDSGISEIDLIIPTPNTTYDVGTNGRFPLVWAVRNPSLWKGQKATLEWNFQKEAKSGHSDLLDADDGKFNTFNATDGTRYLVYDIYLDPEGEHGIRWQVSGSVCGTPGGFYNGTGTHAGQAAFPPTDGWFFNFTTKPGGQKANFTSVTSDNCSGRTAVAYDFANAMDDRGCRVMDQDDPFPSPAPCDFKISEPDRTSVSQLLDKQFKNTCLDHPYQPSCSLPSSSSTTDKKNAAIQVRRGIGSLLLSMGVPLMTLFL